MIDILAHRANLHGPERASENSLEACRAALEAGFGLEIDLRRTPQGFVISHDPAPWSKENDFGAFQTLFEKHATLRQAVNVKELGYESELVRLAREGAFGEAPFYFDFELLEPQSPGAAQRTLRSLPGSDAVTLASRLSDRNESLAQCLSIPGEVVWADEFDQLWLTRTEIEAVQKAGRKVYAVSPDLHGYGDDVRRRRWNDFKAWGVDGLCTDYPLEAREFFSR